MKTFGALSRLAPRPHLRGYTPISQLGICRRHIATRDPVDKQVDEKLPLAGIRVLDMTRVLAGVGTCYSGL
jgi:succinate--hydroxymethylglutarate CoA-transferase